MTKLRASIGLFAIGLILPFVTGCIFFQNQISVSSLHHFRGEYDPSTMELVFIFVHGGTYYDFERHSFQLLSEESGRKVFQLTLYGRHNSKGWQSGSNATLSRKDEFYLITLPDVQFRLGSDIVIYSDRNGKSRIPVFKKSESRNVGYPDPR